MPERSQTSNHHNPSGTNFKNWKSQHSHLYNSRRWRKASKGFLQHPDNLECKYCGKLSELVNHNPPHRGNLSMFWDVAATWEPCCRKCHARITGAGH